MDRRGRQTRGAEKAEESEKGVSEEEGSKKKKFLTFRDQDEAMKKK